MVTAAGRGAALAMGLMLAAGFATAKQPAPPLPPIGAAPVVLPAPPPTPVAPPRPLSADDVAAIVTAVRAASEFAAPPDLDTAAAAFASEDAGARGAAEEEIVKAAVTLAKEEHGRLADPQAVDANWALRGRYDAGEDFAAARAEGRIPSWAEALPRRSERYLALVAAERRYEAILIHGGWQALPTGVTLTHGAKGKDVVRLRARLASEGYGASDGDAVFDRGLGGEVAEFQVRHGLKPSGAVDAATLAALNVPAATRLWTLAANLERERWLPDQFPPDRIEANVGSAEVTLFEGDQPTLRMRSIVGEPSRPTPLFVSHVSSIEFNPAWHVPDDIAKAELWPKGRGYLASHGYEVIDGQLVQRAGPHSSLGRVKFEMPNPFSVYLHDTPGRALFAVDSRGRSHGCVRLERPNDLAVALLSDQGWDLQRVSDTIDKGDTHWVKPKSNMPVYILYRTADSPDDGPAIFRPDIYGWDGKLAAALIAAAR